MPDNSVDFTLTDIPYNKPFVKQTDRSFVSSISSMNKGMANVMTFDLDAFIPEVLRVTRGNLVCFCGIEQLSQIANLVRQEKGTMRLLIWRKTNPIPANGQFAYLSGFEQGIYFRKPYGVFNAHCKLPIFYSGKQNHQIHPTEKAHKVLKELIKDLSNPGEIVFDPCSGSGSTGYCATQLGRSFIGCERHLPYYKSAWKRLAHGKPLRNSLLDEGMCS